MRIVNRVGSSVRRTSDHASGADTHAPATGRTEYGAASVCPERFCRKSRYTRFCRSAGERTTLVVSGSWRLTMFATTSANWRATSVG